MIRFDQSINTALQIVRSRVDKISQIHIVRDTSGSLTIILPDDVLANGQWESLGNELHNALEPYSSGARRVLLPESELIEAEQILDSNEKISISKNVWLIDQLLTNQDWARKPLRQSSRVPTAVGFSIKGGVGRSTALSMCSWYFSRNAKNVLVIDLDLEAPGISSILLDQLPDYGLVDWLIEEMNGQGTTELLESAIEESPISQNESGRVRVLPVYGKLSKEYISKLGRVFAPTFSADGNIVGLAERLDKLLECVQELDSPPDIVLIDARAGMHDIGSAVVTRLGAEVLMFARDDKQDWWGYEQVFDNLRFSSSVAGGMGNDEDLRWKLKMVAAQTPPREDARKKYLKSSYSCWNKFYDDESAETENSKFKAHVFDIDSPEAPHFPLYVNFDLGVKGMSLTDPATRPEWGYIEGIFSDFFRGVDECLFPGQAQVRAEEHA